MTKAERSINQVIKEIHLQEKLLYSLMRALPNAGDYCQCNTPNEVTLINRTSEVRETRTYCIKCGGWAETIPDYWRKDKIEGVENKRRIIVRSKV